VIEGWKFEIATDEAAITDDHQTAVIPGKRCG
jgi:hypothetical protein